ncbi:MAG: ATP-binding protein [Alphaproteobacteria bacterium]|nr:ATP-binding protein [Alphaproteobacteria bacterium]
MKPRIIALMGTHATGKTTTVEALHTLLPNACTLTNVTRGVLDTHYGGAIAAIDDSFQQRVAEAYVTAYHNHLALNGKVVIADTHPLRVLAYAKANQQHTRLSTVKQLLAIAEKIDLTVHLPAALDFSVDDDDKRNPAIRDEVAEYTQQHADWLRRQGHRVITVGIPNPVARANAILQTMVAQRMVFG